MRQSEDAISKAVLGGTLTSTTSQSGGGAFALGQVHNEVRHDILASDARQLAATLSRDLLWPLLVLNRPGSPDVAPGAAPSLRPARASRHHQHGPVDSGTGQRGAGDSQRLGL
nr:DUF935 family protein [Pseudomonas aeruginosa]